MRSTFGQILAGIPKPPTPQEVLNLFAHDDPIERGQTTSCRNAAAPLDGLLSEEKSFHRPYDNLERSLISKADSEGDEQRHLVEQIVSYLNRTPTSDPDKMAILAIIMTKLDDIDFLEIQRDEIRKRVPSLRLPH